MAIDQSNEEATTGYAYKASLIGSAHRFRLTDTGLSWHIAGRSGGLAYADIASIRLSYRPISMQSRRFRADIENKGGGRIAVLSTTWQTVSLVAPQDTATAPSLSNCTVCRKPAARPRCPAGSGHTYAAAVLVLVVLGVAMVGLLLRALFTGELMGALFLVGLHACSPGRSAASSPAMTRSYSFDDLPEGLLP